MRLKTERAATFNPSSRPNRVGGSGDPERQHKRAGPPGAITAGPAAAYDIPVSFDTLTRVVASNSVANVTSATPGGASVTQAFNDAPFKGITSPTNAIV